MAATDAYGNPDKPVADETIASTWGSAVVDRSVPIYPDTTARDAEIASPDEGQVAFVEGTGLQYYNADSEWILVNPHIDAGLDQDNGLSYTTSETAFVSQTITCDYAAQPVCVEVHVWARSQAIASGTYIWCRPQINGTAQGAQISVQTGPYASSHGSAIIETVADGSGEVTVAALVKIETGSVSDGVASITWKVTRLET